MADDVIHTRQQHSEYYHFGKRKRATVTYLFTVFTTMRRFLVCRFNSDLCHALQQQIKLVTSISPDQVLLVGHVGFAGSQRHVAVVVPGEAVLGDAVVPVGEETRRAAAGARIAAVHGRVTDVRGVGREDGLVEAEGDTLRHVRPTK